MHQRILSIPRVSGRPRAALGRTGCREIHADGPAGRRPLGAGGLTPSGVSPTDAPELARSRLAGPGAGSRGVVRPAAHQREDPAPLRPTQALTLLLPALWGASHPKGLPQRRAPLPGSQTVPGGAERARGAPDDHPERPYGRPGGSQGPPRTREARGERTEAEKRQRRRPRPRQLGRGSKGWEGWQEIAGVNFPP